MMNVEKQLKEISNYHEMLRKENARLNNLVDEYFGELQQCKIALLDKVVDEIEQLPTINYFTHENLKSQFNFVMAQMERLSKENARLRETLRWHPITEMPKADVKYYSGFMSVDVIVKDYVKGKINIAYMTDNKWLLAGKHYELLNPSFESKWCYIPQDKDGE